MTEVTKDITVTEEEIESQFATLVSEAKTEYDEDKSAFVTDYQSGNTIYYTPEGMFFVKHILIGLTEEQQQEIKDLRADEDETVAATADAKRDEYLLTIREEAEAVLARVDAGEDFDALIEEYGDDPGHERVPGRLPDVRRGYQLCGRVRRGLRGPDRGRHDQRPCRLGLWLPHHPPRFDPARGRGDACRRARRAPGVHAPGGEGHRLQRPDRRLGGGGQRHHRDRKALIAQVG